MGGGLPGVIDLSVCLSVGLGSGRLMEFPSQLVASHPRPVMMCTSVL
jgi:hypothetical protein